MFKRNDDPATNTKAEMAAEKRQMDFAREQSITSAATNPDDDQTYIQTQQLKSDLIRWQQELDPELMSLVLTFRGLRKLTNKKIIPILDENDEPIASLCNSLFIHQIVIPKMKPFASKNLINSNYDEKRTLLKLQYTADDIVDVMSDNWDKYGIKFVNFDTILRDIKNFMEDCQWRALKGWTKKTDNAMTKRIESEVYGEQQPNKKGFKSLFGA